MRFVSVFPVSSTDSPTDDPPAAAFVVVTLDSLFRGVLATTGDVAAATATATTGAATFSTTTGEGETV